MPIRFCCESCQQLSSIATRKAGSIVACPTCGTEVIVPHDDGLARIVTPEEIAVEFAEAPQSDEDSATDQLASAPDRTEIKVRGGIRIDEHIQPRTSDLDEDEEDDFQLRRSETDFGDLDMTPMIDVTFLLLIFFMITASFSLQKTLQVPKPGPDEMGAQQQQTLDDFEANSVIVQIDERNDIKIDYDPLSDAADLIDALYDKKRSEQKNEILIEAHPNSWQETVVTVIDAANEVGMERIRLAELNSQ